ncbi:carboxypeptidase-like regulatory domain-containing protein [Mucilaginibacter xinganensis]|uniref:CarboxypepD_reg-like domain-containing protein n=1 Tax=Mucilaginibacter xinganensis TaxID=1234841 RepID=A0A223NV23_9SPHI|nr:carboxypeptidase-like regulatory domain-containing protein [Mucilaginibacter xinganensis]ASU33610.1 hypothetical protein MuYL_1714 [Mucilaginibacter xinganensis]
MKLKNLPLLLFCMVITHSYGQLVSGKVIDSDTKLPVSGAVISLGKKQTITGSFGDFRIPASGGDSLRIVRFGYKTYTKLVINPMDAIKVDLEPAKIVIKEVIIHANREREYKKDSAYNRQFYAKQFNYKGPTVMDAFVHHIPKNTSELLSVDVVTLIRALTKKSTRAYKFNKLLLRDEKTNYINQKFSHGMVSKVTGLRGDTLSAFIIQYRPTYAYAQKATDYEMEVYIKECYKKFLKDGFKKNELFNASRKDSVIFRLN